MDNLRKSLYNEFYKLKSLGLLKHFALRSIVIALGLNVLVLVFQDAQDEGVSGTYFSIFNWFSRYAFGPYMMIAVITTTAKEFDWGTIHHLALKGQKVWNFVLSKWLVMVLFGFALYTIIAAVLITIFMVYSSGNYFRVNFYDIFCNYFYFMMFVSIGTTAAVIAQSTVRALVYSIIYFFIFEAAFFNLAGWVAGKFDLFFFRDIMDYSPWSVVTLLSTGEAGNSVFWSGLAGSLLYYVLFLAGSVVLMSRRELIRPRS